MHGLHRRAALTPDKLSNEARSWHAENVANMLENPVSPTMRLEDTASFAWADGSNATCLQATRDLVVPNSDGLVILKVCEDVTPLV